MLDKIRNYIPFITVLAVGLLPLFDLFNSGIPLTHDGQDHVARIANFYTALSEGILIPRWGGNLNWGFGHPVLMFLYPLPSYIASLFIFAGFSYPDSVKIVFGLSFLVSGAGMYFWISRLLGTNAGIISAFLYMLAPYRFVNLYVRGAIGEHVAFAFAPFVFFFITCLFQSKNSQRSISLYALGVAVSTGLLILSHNALSIIFLGAAGLYVLVLFSVNRNINRLLLSGSSILYGFLLSAFFWLPAFYEGKYTLRDIVTGGGEYASRFVPNILDFILPYWSYGITGEFSVQVGIVHLSLVILGVIVFFRLSPKKIKEKRIFILMISLFLFSLFLMLKESNFIWNTFTTLQKFQFPWRFLSLTVFTSAVLGGYFVTVITKKKRGVFAVFFVLFLIIAFYSPYWHANGYLIKEQSFYSSIYNSTTDTGESSPEWSVRFMEERPKSHIEVISGNADIKKLHRSSAEHLYEVIADGDVQLKENTLYFPGWNVYVNDNRLDVNSQIEFQNEQHRGVMTFRVPEGRNTVRVVFTETRFRMMANAISAGSFIILLVLLYIFTRKAK